jgi:hypothetical protein
LAGALLVAGLACGPRPATPIPLQVDMIERASITERASRSRVRPLQPPAAPDTTTTVAARPAPQRTTRPPAGDRWARLRKCESGGDYRADTGNGFYGAYQFTLGTWRSVGGAGSPALASPAEQDARAQLLYQRRGAQPWPICGRYL